MISSSAGSFPAGKSVENGSHHQECDAALDRELKGANQEKANGAALSAPLLFFLKSFVFSEFLTILDFQVGKPL
jgi:hypothetical protein